MTASRKKLVTSSVLLLGIGALVVAGMSLYPSLRERYWLWKLDTGSKEEQLEATARLAELSSLEAIPSLIEVTAAALDDDWAIILPGSSLDSRPFALRPNLFHLRNPYAAFLEAIRKISRDRHESAKKLLEPLLSDDREIVRAVAASVLFYGTDRAQVYVSRERILEVNPERATY